MSKNKTYCLQSKASEQTALLLHYLLVCAAVVASGCGTPPTIVTGIVTLDGEMLPGASVQFFPVNGKGQPVGTTADEEGRYHAEVSPGLHRVVISKREVTAYRESGREPADPGGPIVEERVPTIYTDEATTPLIADPVEKVTTTIDFSLPWPQEEQVE